MADELTPNFGFIKPERDVNAPVGGWADKLNENLDLLDETLTNISGTAASASTDPQLRTDINNLSGTVTQHSLDIANINGTLAGLSGGGSGGGSSSSSTSTNSPVIQTVLSARTDAYGYPNYLEASGSFINLYASTEDPVVLSFADGLDNHVKTVSGTLDAAWSLPANKTSYLYVGLDANGDVVTGGYTSNAAVYSESVPVFEGIDVSTSNNTISNGYTTQYGADYATNAFDKNPGTRWVSITNGAIGDWIGQDFGAATEIQSIRITQAALGGGNSYNQVDVEISDDLEAWSKVGSTYVLTSSDEEISIPVGYGARAWRVVAMAGYGGNWVVYEVKMVARNLPVGVNWFDVPKRKMRVSPSWGPVVRLFVGQATTNEAGDVVNVIPYALSARYKSPEIPISPGTTYNFAHNIGDTPDNLTMTGIIRDLSSGFAVPYSVDVAYDYQAALNTFGAYPSKYDILTYKARTASSYTMGYIDPNGVYRSVSSVNGAGLTINIKRNW